MSLKTAILAAALAGAAATGLHAQASADDPYLWLEEVSSPRAMDWVNAHNAKAQAVLEADPRYQAYYNEALAIAQAKDRIPFGRFLNGQVYNFWQDADHVRGVFRRASLAGYQAESPAWETVLDLDALAASEKANWVFKGVDCARPAERRCLINLSDGGEDAVTIREFDLPSGKFVDGGFVIPKGKSRATWEDENNLLISREWAPGDLGRTGYPFIVKRLKRGQPLSAAVEVFRGSAEDGGYGVTPYVLRDGENRTLAVIDRPLDTFRSETYILTPKGPQRVAIPAKANLSDMVAGRVIIETREDWRPAGSATTYPAGALLSVDLAQLRADPTHPKPTLIFAAGPREAMQSATASKGVLLVSILDNVRGRTLLFTPGPRGTWTRSSLQLPDNSTIGLVDASSTDNKAFVSVTSFLTPPSLWLADAATGQARQIKAQPAKFDASNLVAEQFEAVSSDGTKIPYFLVHRRRTSSSTATTRPCSTPMAASNPPRPRLIRRPPASCGSSMAASMRSPTSAAAASSGRNGTRPGLGTKRQIIYDDFVAVGRDLIARQVTSPRRLGIRGGSNGGLLMGVAFTQHPELWNAALIEVPLLDMIRISKIAAGASWEGEYGSIDKDPAVRAFWEKTSPYQNLHKGGTYPEPFIFTTTKDDRVGPQHARKFAARMEEMGLPFLLL
jgi:prolyl oligopeptidase